jgi:hypothetical protein
MVRNCDGQERACCVACQELERRALRHTSMAEVRPTTSSLRELGSTGADATLLR